MALVVPHLPIAGRRLQPVAGKTVERLFTQRTQKR